MSLHKFSFQKHQLCFNLRILYHRLHFPSYNLRLTATELLKLRRDIQENDFSFNPIINMYIHDHGSMQDHGVRKTIIQILKKGHNSSLLSHILFLIFVALSLHLFLSLSLSLTLFLFIWFLEFWDFLFNINWCDISY